MEPTPYARGPLGMDNNVDLRDEVDDMDEAEMNDVDLDDEVDELEAQKAQIEQTRAELSGTIDAIKEKLEPQHLVQQAKDTVREATIGRAQDAVGSAVDSARHVMSNATEGARDAGESFVGILRENPIPAAMVGIGLGWLMMSARRSDTMTYRRYRDDRYDRYRTDYGTTDRDRAGYYGATGTERNYRYEELRPEASGYTGSETSMRDRAGEMAGNVRDRVGDVAGSVRDRVGDVAGSVRDRVGDTMDRTRETAAEAAERARYNATLARMEARRGGEFVSEGFQRTLQDNPVALGLVAMGLGAAVGFVLPETDREHEMMGEARDRLMDRAQETAQQLGDKAKSVAREAVNTAKEAAQDQGLMDQARGVAERAVDAAKSAAQDQGTSGSGMGGASVSGGMTSGGMVSGGVASGADLGATGSGLGTGASGSFGTGASGNPGTSGSDDLTSGTSGTARTTSSDAI